MFELCTIVHEMYENKVSDKKMYFILVNVIKQLNQAINVIYTINFLT